MRAAADTADSRRGPADAVVQAVALFGEKGVVDRQRPLAEGRRVGPTEDDRGLSTLATGIDDGRRRLVGVGDGRRDRRR